MGRCIVRLGTKYVEWSTVSDAPATYGLTREQLETFVKDKYGREGLSDLPQRMARVDQCGTSMLDDDQSAEDTTMFNRAGPNEATLSFPDLVALYDGGAKDWDVMRAKKA